MTAVVMLNERVAIVFLDRADEAVKPAHKGPAKSESALNVPGRFVSEEQFALWMNENLPSDLRSGDPGWVDINSFTSDAYTIAICTENPVHVLHMDELARYFFEGPFAGEYWGYKCLDQRGGYGRLFLLDVDTTKCRHDDLGDALPGIWPHFKDGSPIRKTNRAGAGTKGTQAVEGLGCDFWVAFN